MGKHDGVRLGLEAKGVVVHINTDESHGVQLRCLSPSSCGLYRVEYLEKGLDKGI